MRRRGLEPPLSGCSAGAAIVVSREASGGLAMARYGFEQEQPERLAGIEATWDPGTRALLDSLGIGRGWRCLEAGAGGGSIATWMAERVGPEGSVLAVDLDTTLVERLAGEVLEVRRHDLLRDELPATRLTSSTRDRCCPGWEKATRSSGWSLRWPCRRLRRTSTGRGCAASRATRATAARAPSGRARRSAPAAAAARVDRRRRARQRPLDGGGVAGRGRGRARAERAQPDAASDGAIAHRHRTIIPTGLRCSRLQGNALERT